MGYIIGGLIGATLAAMATEKFWYPPPDISGAPLGLLAAFILMGGGALGATFTWVIDRLARR